MFGVWDPTETPQSILGPLAYEFIDAHDGGFSAQRDPKTGEVWFTVLSGQIFRVQDKQMQYCFGPGGSNKTLFEQSPFSVDSIHDTNVTFCWREGLIGMATHTRECRGCDCAKITIDMPTDDTLHFQFWQSPPVLHADITLKRKSAAPDMTAITSTMDNPYEECTFKDHYGPNYPANPSLRPNKTTSFAQHSAAYELAAGPQVGVGCAAGLKMKQQIRDALARSNAEEDADAAGVCRQLNGINLELSKLSPFKHFDPIPDVRVQYIPPAMPCAPCKVAYSVSAAIAEDEYVAVGFKGQSWEAMFPIAPFNDKRPCYFGMCVDKYDNFTSDRIAVGYSGGSGACFREMVSPNIVGSPVDVPKDSQILETAGVTRKGKRTVLKFTILQHWPDQMPADGPWRIMWATGKVTPKNGATGCDASLGYHDKNRGVAPLEWLSMVEGGGIGSTTCKYVPEEMDW